MKSEIISEKKIQFTTKLNEDITQIYETLTKPHYMSQWLGNNVHKTSKGFDVEINLPLYQINISATIISFKPPEKFEFLWKSEYVMRNSVVTYSLQESNDGVKLKIEEVGDFDQSRWSDSQKIHIDLWKQAIGRLEKFVSH